MAHHVGQAEDCAGKIISAPFHPSQLCAVLRDASRSSCGYLVGHCTTADGQVFNADLEYMGEDRCRKLQQLQRVGVEGQVPACDQTITHGTRLQRMKQGPLHEEPHLKYRPKPLKPGRKRAFFDKKCQDQTKVYQARAAV